MKKNIYVLCAVLMGVFASCSKSEMGGETPQFNQVTLKVATDEGLQTRANATGVSRYAIEVYTDANYSTVANVFSDGSTNRANNAIGVFSMTLDRTKAYYCLLWADKDSTSSVYTITSLKDVALTGKAVEAWHGITTISAGTEAKLTATLTRAVSKITLMESGKLEVPASATLKLNFSQPTKFNVATKTASENSARSEEVITISTNVDGTNTPAKLNATDIFVLSLTGIVYTDLTFQYNEEALFNMSVPLQANFNTIITGHYTSAKSTNFTVTADDEWKTPNNNVKFAKVKVGDFYYSDKTFSSTYTQNTQNPCIGIVFAVNADARTGKIVSLNENKNTTWSTENIIIGASSATDGAANTTRILALKTYTATVYPVFAWCAMQKNAITGINWYVPAKEELKALYGKYTDGTDTNEDARVKIAVNRSLNAANATPLSGDYWSSTEDTIYNAWNVSFNDGSGATNSFNKNGNTGNVRVVAAF